MTIYHVLNHITPKRLESVCRVDHVKQVRSLQSYVQYGHLRAIPCASPGSHILSTQSCHMSHPFPPSSSPATQVLGTRTVTPMP